MNVPHDLFRRRLGELLDLGETEWVEFKVNDAVPEEIGEYLSAVSNSALLHGQARGAIIWGVEDGTHEIVGTTFAPRQRKTGGEDLEPWLVRLLTPRLDLRIMEDEVDGKRVVIFDVPAASHTPVRFREHEWIRVGSYKKKLRDYPEKEREIWRLLSRRTADFESETTVRGLAAEDVLRLLDANGYFALLNRPVPSDSKAVLLALEADRLVLGEDTASWAITNLGALAIATDLSRFDALRRKAPRVVVYRGRDRTHTVREQQGRRGYANGFRGLVAFIESQLPQNEEIVEALRTEARIYPSIAIRELVANALIHQDFSISGTGPMVEIFEDRVEITNPGAPLIETSRLIDAPPQSRNERLAALARRMNICEERGSGIDKVIFEVELYQLPAPRFDATDTHMRVTLFAPQNLRRMEPADRVRACYQHACLKWVSNDKMTNATLRKRFGIEDQNYSIASRIIGDTVDASLIKRSDPESTSKKHAAYVPYFA